MFKRFYKKMIGMDNEFPKYFKRIEHIDLAPLFILGSNRSGTSLITSILAQHPKLEGIFPLSQKSFPSSEEYGHVVAYCTSHHVWNFITNLNNDWAEKDEGILWGHPKHISRFYRDRPKNDKETLLLANALKFYCRSDRTPLVNSHFNMFRIGLITKIFPNSKFILIIRDYKDHMRSCIHKWSKQSFNIEYPKIGLHWLTLNSCCIYDLKKYAEGNFIIVDYFSLFNDQKKVNHTLNVKLEKIGLEKFHFNLDIVSAKHRYLGKKHITNLKYEDFFQGIDSLLSFEKDLTDGSFS